MDFRKVERATATERAKATSTSAESACTTPAKKAKTTPTQPTSGVTYGAAAGEDEPCGFDFGDGAETVEESEKTEEEFAAEDEKAAGVEFLRVFKAWYNLNVDYAQEFPHDNLVPDANRHFDLIRGLMGLDMGRLYSRIISEDPDRASFGFLPLMAGCSDGQIGALNAESFALRVISTANLVMTEGITLLCDEDLEMLVVQ
jgi:hypothetical protein